MTASSTVAVRRALLSVSDKTGLIDLARALANRGIELLSTGGTAKALREAGLAVRDVSELTGFPEIMDGRVKTLHPKVHGGLLGRRGVDDAVMAAHGILPIDLLVLNLYPFERVSTDPNSSFDDIVENIDIGGPAMLRAAAKNFAHVAVATDPAQYPALLAELAAEDGALSAKTRFALAVAAFNRVAQYDAFISNHLSAIQDDGSLALFPAQNNSNFVKVMDLRYGENPHQQGAFYRDLWPVPGTLATFTQLQGKELSYNNLADADAAWECVRQFEQPACVIVKHANPCGVAVGADCAGTYEVRVCDRSHFGVRRHHRVQWQARRRDREDHPRPSVRRGADRAGFRRRRAGLLHEESERARAAHSAWAWPQQHGREAGRLGPADADRRYPRSHAR